MWFLLGVLFLIFVFFLFFFVINETAHRTRSVHRIIVYEDK